jgi:uncharacterized SAM-binding protein YcdF (DUF218 family)
LQAAAIAGTAAAALLLVGFVRFIIPPPGENDPMQTDAIVVLTGGDLRLRSGIELMRAGKGHVLFVSGVNRRVDLDHLLRFAGAKSAKNWLICCIVLGREAKNTAGNAEETEEWMRRLGYHSLRLVTAWYHMPRSLLEFRRAMPDIEIIPHPVFSEEPASQNSLGWRGTVPVLISEYGKYLAAIFVPLVDRPSLAGAHRMGAEAQR